jgi:hypothetical protein
MRLAITRFWLVVIVLPVTVVPKTRTEINLMGALSESQPRALSVQDDDQCVSLSSPFALISIMG